MHNTLIILAILCIAPIKSFAGIDNSTLMRLTKEINKNLPVMLDKDTRLESMLAINNKFTYFYTMINLKKNSINIDTFYKGMLPFLLNSTCTQPQSLKLINKGITTAYNYSDKNRIFLMEVVVSPKHCKRIK